MSLGAIHTEAIEINPAGEIVGRYGGADGVVHGFLLSRKELGKRNCGLPISDCGLSQLRKIDCIKWPLHFALVSPRRSGPGRSFAPRKAQDVLGARERRG